MLTQCAKDLMSHLATMYKQTGRNEFGFEDYFTVPNHDLAIRELVGKGYLTQDNNILATIHINLDALKDD